MVSMTLALRVLLALTCVVGLIWYIGRRFGGGSAAKRVAREPGVRLVGRQSMGRHTGVAVVAVGNRRILVGYGEQQVTMLTELGPVFDELPLPQPATPEATSTAPTARWAALARSAVGSGLVPSPRNRRAAPPTPATNPEAAGWPTLEGVMGTEPAAVVATPVAVPLPVPVATAQPEAASALAGSILAPETWRQAVRSLQDRTVRR